MSFLHMALAMKVKTGSTHTKMVLIKLADYANEDTGECFPSLATIAEQCEMSKRSVSNQIDKLIEMGLVVKTERFQDGKQRSNTYRLSLNRVAHRATPIARAAPPHCKRCNQNLSMNLSMNLKILCPFLTKQTARSWTSSKRLLNISGNQECERPRSKTPRKPSSRLPRSEQSTR